MLFSRQLVSRVNMSTAASHLPRVNKKISVKKISQVFREATEIVTVPLPKPGPGQILIRNRFAGINASDINITAARYDPAHAPQQPPFDCGFEGIGHVVAIGEDCKHVKEGQAVAYIGMGSFAEYTVISGKFALPVPSVKAEYLPLLVSGLTASLSLDKIADMKPGEVVLVTAAAGGTGQFAVQLAKNKGCHVIGTCSSEEKVQFLKEIGCDRPINYNNENVKSVLKSEYKKGVDVVYETVGGDMFDTCLTNLAIGGRLVVIGFIQGYENDMGFAKSKKAAMIQPLLLQKSASVRGFLLFHFAQLWPEYLQKLVAMYERGEIKSNIDNGRFSSTGSFRGIVGVAEAVDYMYSRKNLGKVVVEFPQHDSNL